MTATLFNPVTLEKKSVCVRDYDYDDCSRDNDEVYDMPIIPEAVSAWYRFNGIIQPGDTVEVFKGRKIPVGTIAVVESISEWKDAYGRVQTIYAHFTDGRRTSIDNCRFSD